MRTSICNLDLSSKTIVIVEDDFYSIKYYEMLLSTSGANIQVLKSGLEFVEYIKEENKAIDFIFMDYLIPFITGTECIKIYRKINRTTPIVMLTAYASELAKTEAFLAGCNEYVMKPIYGEKLTFLLEKYLVNSYVAESII
jgi:CheY-like chemotaxis protein